ncbi:hypothetical protein EV426DRAFT_573198 [Tirmania nivea]|nr:hypothetical protein EV426DRAFT_573198 [Tirmania nivea]
MANTMQPSILGPRDNLYRALIPGDRNQEQRKKKKVSDEPSELNSHHGKRQNTSRGRGKSFVETHDRGFHVTNQITAFGMNRHSTAKLKSEQLKEGLAGGSATNNMKDIQKQERFSIPHDHYQACMQKRQPVRNGMSLDATDSGDESGLDIIGNIIPLIRFRRGRFVLKDKTRVLVGLDHGKFNIFEGDHEWKEYGFLLSEVKTVWMNSTKDYVQIILSRDHIDLPNGRQIWLKLKSPCLDIDRRFFKDKHCQITPTPKIEEREAKFTSISGPQPPAIYKATQDHGLEALNRKHPDTVSDSPLTGRTRDVRNTRSRNAQRAKPVTSLLFGVEDNGNAYPGSPSRPLSLMSKADRDKPPLVWPPSGKKRVTVDYQDLERLEEEQFLNDNIINFYLRYLEEKLARDDPALAQQTHFFNTFFYERLSQKTADKKANFQALMKWTARVDLFAKQYVIIPINENAHWYLAIICNLPYLEAKLQSNNRNCLSEEAEATTVSTPDSPIEEVASSEVELPLVTEATVESSDRMDIDDPNQQGPTTAESQLLSELSNLKPANPPEPMVIDEPDSGHEDEWPSEEGLEGVSNHHISEFNYSGDGEIIVNIDDSDKKGVTRQKKLSARVKKPPKPVDLNNPTIIILDSLSMGLHPRTLSLLKEYLEVEAYEKKGWIVPRGVVAGIYAKVPRQPNHCDCGVYLLCYVEGFLHAAETFAQEFIQKVDCQEGRFDDVAFTGKRQELMELIIRLHKDQYGDRGKHDVANGCDVEAHAQPNSRRAPSEEIQELKHEGGGPRPVEHSAAMKESDPRPRVPSQKVMDLVNSIQSQGFMAERGDEQLTDLVPTGLTQSSGITQRRRFTPEQEIERQTGPGPTSSSHFSHVEIPKKARAGSPASLQSSSFSSSESTPITKEPWRAPLRAQKSPSVPESHDYAMSIDRDFEAAVFTEL